ncbi:MAG: cobaltochelatase subunit CobN [Methanosarcinaceae archaeon]|nr:cobaltochelatase subunit CobN [Methanosarcinaceae archaeon]
MFFFEKRIFSKTALLLIILISVLSLTVSCALAEEQNTLVFKAENMSNTTQTEFELGAGDYSLFYIYQMGKHETGKNFYPYLIELSVNESGVYTKKIGSDVIEPKLFEVPDKENDVKPIKVTDELLRLNKIFDDLKTVEPVAQDFEKIGNLSLTFPYNNSCWYLFNGPSLIYSDINVTESDELNEYSVSFEVLVVGEDEIEVLFKQKSDDLVLKSLNMNPADKTILSNTKNDGSQRLFYKNEIEKINPGEYIFEIFAIKNKNGSDNEKEKIKICSEEILIEEKDADDSVPYMPGFVEPCAKLVFKSENMSNTTKTDLNLNFGKYEFLFYYQMGKYETGKSYYPYTISVEVNETGVFSNGEPFEIPEKDIIKPAKISDEKQRLNRVFDFLNKTDSEKTVSEESKTVELTYPYNNSCWYVFKEPALLYSDIVYEKDEETSNYNVKMELLILGDKETKVKLGEKEISLLPEEKSVLSGTENQNSAAMFYNFELKDVVSGENKLIIESVSFDGSKKILAEDTFNLKEKADDGIPIKSEKNVIIITGCTYQVSAAENLIKDGFSQDPENLIHLSHYQTTMYDIGAEPLLSEMRNDIEKADIIYINMINTTVKGPIVLDAFRKAKEKDPSYKPIIFVSNLTDKIFENELEINIPESVNKDAYEVELYMYFSNSGYDEKNLENMIYKLLNDFDDCNFNVEEPNALPDNAIYHPDYKNKVFETQKEYLEWYKNRETGHRYNPENGTVGIMFYQSYYPGKIEPIDDTVYELENLGINVIPIYLYSSTASKVCPKYFKADDGEGELLVDVVISLSRYLSKPPFDVEEFDVPVINGAVTKLNESEWKKSQNPFSSWMNRYYRPETNGMIDPINLGYTEMIEGVETYLSNSDQIKYLAERTNGYIKLKNLENEDKNVAIIYYNHDGGKDSIGASYLNVPSSLSNLLKAMKSENYNIDDKYSTDSENQSLEKTLTDSMLTYGYNAGNWAPGQIESMVQTGKVVMIPADVYEKWFDEFFGNDPDKEEHKKQVIEEWGEAPGNLMTYKKGDKNYIVIPLVDVSFENGNLGKEESEGKAGKEKGEEKVGKEGKVIMAPQPSRGWFSDYEKLYHDGSLVPNHQYIAFYSWLKHSEEDGGFGADVIVYMGRHGTQEWLPGKETGLYRYEWPPLMHSDIPVVYYYVVDGISEGIQAKRRGNAVIVDHLTPAIVKADYNGKYSELGDLIVNYKNAVRNELDKEIIDGYKEALFETAEELNVNLLIKTDPNAAKEDPEILEEYLDEIGETIYLIKTESMPYGLHILGTSPSGNALANTIHLMLGQGYLDSLNEIAKEKKIERDIESISIDLINSVIIEGKDVESSLNEIFGSVGNVDEEDVLKIKPYMENAEKYSKGFKDSEHETSQLIRAMNAGYISPGVAGDPVAKPHILPTGYNFQTVDSSKVPTEVTQKLGQKLAKGILDEYKKSGDYPETMAYVLWSSETVRHEGVMEACILYLMGVEYDFSSSASPTDKNLRVVEGFDYPTMDVVMQISGLYRDMFPDLIQRIDDAVVLAASVENPKGNKLKEHIEETKQDLMSKNPDLSEEDAFKMASVRIFGEAPDNYGTGMSNAAAASDSWEERTKLGEYYIENMGHLYANRTIGENNVLIWGLDAKEMEILATGKSVQNGSDLFKRAVKDVEVTIHSRSTNLYGVIDNDDFFQYLGGLNLAIATMNEGKYPNSFIMDLKKPGDEKFTDLKTYVENEMTTRYFNPDWAEGMMQHGYSGAVEMSDFVENLWGWDAMMPDVVSDKAWDGVYEVYIKDGEIYDFLNSNENSYSLQSITSRLLEVARTENWNPTDEQLKDIVKKQVESVVQNGPACCHHTCGNPLAAEFISGMISQLNVVDEDTAKKYIDIMKELKETKETEEEDEKNVEKNKSGGSIGFAKIVSKDDVAVAPEDENKTIPKISEDDKLENETKSQPESQKQLNETGEGVGKDPGAPGKQVSGITMVQKTFDSASKQVMEFLKNPTFSSASLVAILLIVIVVGVIYYGYSKRDL